MRASKTILYLVGVHLLLLSGVVRGESSKRSVEMVRDVADRLLQGQGVRISSYRVESYLAISGNWVFSYHLKKSVKVKSGTSEYKVFVNPKTQAACFTKGAFLET